MFSICQQRPPGNFFSEDVDFEGEDLLHALPKRFDEERFDQSKTKKI